MTSWAALYGEHCSLRHKTGERSVLELRNVLRRLAELPGSVLDSRAHQRLQASRNRATGFEVVQFSQDGSEDLHLYEHPEFERAIHLIEAKLTVQLRIHRPTDRLHQLTVMVEGTRRAGGPWVVAVHLPDDRPNDMSSQPDRQGHGACGHAALHAHVGPTMNDEPKVRVPLPTVSAGQILEWVLSQVVPTVDFEAAPWAAIAPVS